MTKRTFARTDMAVYSIKRGSGGLPTTHVITDLMCCLPQIPLELIQLIFMTRIVVQANYNKNHKHVFFHKKYDGVFITTQLKKEAMEKAMTFWDSAIEKIKKGEVEKFSKLRAFEFCHSCGVLAHVKCKHCTLEICSATDPKSKFCGPVCETMYWEANL